MTTRPTPLADRLRAFVATACAALVLALAVLAASPRAHAALHDGQCHHGGDEDACAVVLFAGGVSLPVGAIAIAPPAALAASTPRLAAAEVFLVSPRYLLQPERGPPVSGRV